MDRKHPDPGGRWRLSGLRQVRPGRVCVVDASVCRRELRSLIIVTFNTIAYMFLRQIPGLGP